MSDAAMSVSERQTQTLKELTETFKSLNADALAYREAAVSIHDCKATSI